MRGFQWLLLAGLALFVGSAAPAQPAKKPAASRTAPATVKQLMEAIESASNVVYGVAVEAPKTSEDWTRVEQNAGMLTENGNLLMTGDYAKGRRDWIRWARALVAASTKAVSAAKKKNVDAVLDAGDEIQVNCEACHAKYLQAPAGAKSRAEPPPYGGPSAFFMTDGARDLDQERLARSRY